MTTFFTKFAERAEKRAQYRRTVREISSMSLRDAYDAGLHPSQAHEIAYKAVYG